MEQKRISLPAPVSAQSAQTVGAAGGNSALTAAGKPVKRRLFPARNEVYLTLANRFRWARLAVSITLILFIALMLFFFSKDLTPSRIVDMFRQIEINTTVFTYDNHRRAITYTADKEAAFGSYRDSFVLANRSGVTVYDLGGSTVLSDSYYMSSPALCTSESGFLIYDLGGTSWRLYGTYAMKNSGSCENGISDVAISDSGVYAIVTRTSEYRGVVYVYNEDHVRVSAVYKSRLITDVQISPDGKQLLILSVGNADGDYSAEIMTYRIGEEEPAITLTIKGVLPVSAGWHADGGFTVLFDDALRFYAADGSLTLVYEFGEYTPLACCVDGDLTMIAFNRNVIGDTNDVLVFDGAGHTVWEGDVTGHIVRMLRRGRVVYVLTSDTATRVDTATGMRGICKVENNALDAVLSRSGDIFLTCYSSRLLSYLVASSFVNQS